MPPVRLTAVVLGGLVVTGLVALGAAWKASRIRAGVTLRSA